MRIINITNKRLKEIVTVFDLINEKFMKLLLKKTQISRKKF